MAAQHTLVFLTALQPVTSMAFIKAATRSSSGATNSFPPAALPRGQSFTQAFKHAVVIHDQTEVLAGIAQDSPRNGLLSYSSWMLS
ncbi:MAG: hypothetical protein V4713_14010 [Pseudomonadota bacterium]